MKKIEARADGSLNAFATKRFGRSLKVWPNGDPYPEHMTYRYYYFHYLSRYLDAKRQLIELLITLDAVADPNFEFRPTAEAKHRVRTVISSLTGEWRDKEGAERNLAEIRPRGKARDRLMGVLQETRFALSAGLINTRALAACAEQIIKWIKLMDRVMERHKQLEYEEWNRGAFGTRILASSY
jgi:hypothetical protein